MLTKDWEKDVLDFWFSELTPEQWYAKDDELDRHDHRAVRSAARGDSRDGQCRSRGDARNGAGRNHRARPVRAQHVPRLAEELCRRRQGARACQRRAGCRVRRGHERRREAVPLHAVHAFRDACRPGPLGGAVRGARPRGGAEIRQAASRSDQGVRPVSAPQRHSSAGRPRPPNRPGSTNMAGFDRDIGTTFTFTSKLLASPPGAKYVSLSQ
jgi:hypothetical protein